MVYIGSARSDERGKAHGGAAGDVPLIVLILSPATNTKLSSTQKNMKLKRTPMDCCALTGMGIA